MRLLAVLLIAIAGPAGASSIAYRADGVVSGTWNEIAGAVFPGDAGINVGDPYRADFTIDHLAADLSPDPTEGVYNAVIAYSLTVGAGGYTASGRGEVVVRNDAFLGSDSLIVAATSAPSRGPIVMTSGGRFTPSEPDLLFQSWSLVHLFDASGTALPSKTLPLPLPAQLSPFDDASFLLSFSTTEGKSGGVSGTLTSLRVVPEPRVAILGFAGLLALLLNRAAARGPHRSWVRNRDSDPC